MRTTSMESILVTGGAGYIATHCCVELAQAGYRPVLVDNLSNSKIAAIRRLERLVGRELPFYHIDLRDKAALKAVFAAHEIRAVMHFAGLKAVGESVSRSLDYYDNNLGGTIALCQVMAVAGVKRLVFSSSATVYGNPASVPIREDFPAGAATNPYGRGKFMIEEILRDLCASDPSWRMALLRYFNPVGAHPSGLIGEDPSGIPNNLMPYIAQVAVGKRPHLNVYGHDYPTPDGTGVRDYIHVVDLALGHLAALDYLERHQERLLVNLGTGQGYSVLEVVRAFARACGRAVPYQITGRREGDIATCYADASLAETLLGWRAIRGLDEMCADTWRWQSMNPDGYV